jgi:hypothetical protein
MLGGYHGFPARLGGSKPVARIYHEALRSALPSAIQSVPGSLADCETLATARVLACVWKAQQRYEANLSPRTAYALLGNWAERFRIQVRDGDSVEYIQALCAWKHRVNLYGPSEGAIWDACKLVLGDHLVNVQYRHGTDLCSPPADTYWPESPGPVAWSSSRSLITVQATRGELDANEFGFLMRVRLAEVLDVIAPGYGSWDWEEVAGPVVSDLSKGFDGVLDVKPDTLWFAEDQTLPQLGFVTRKGLSWIVDHESGTTVEKRTNAWGLDDLPTVTFARGGTNNRLGLRCDGLAPGASNAKFLFTLAGPCVLPGAGAEIVYAFTGIDSSNVVNHFINGGNLNIGVKVNGTTITGLTNQGAFPVSQRAIVAVTARPNTSNPANTDVTARVKYSSGMLSFSTYTISSATVGSFVRFGLGFTPYNSAPFYSQNASWGGFVGYKGVGADTNQLDRLIAQWETLYRIS